ncbi:MAG: glycosyltransferase family 9 protein [Ignavibacteria bacterium]|nr:glycosyltransferase family 9 protein [Ignavibacteria bacterium]
MQKRILVVRTDRLGDVIMITPIVREIKKTFPNSYVSVLTRPQTSEVFKYNPYVDSIITDDLSKESFWDVVVKIKEQKFTHGLLVLPTERAAFQMFFGGVRKKYMTGFRLYNLITFFRGVSRKKYRDLKHEADYCMDLARKIGVKTNNIKVELFISEEEKMKADKMLIENGVPLDSFKIFIHTGSGNSAPNWSEDKYLIFIKEIINKFKDKNISIILTAREMTEKFLLEIKNLNYNRIFNLTNVLITVRDLILGISKADLFISSSTGPAHIADALDKKAIVLHCHRNVSSAKHWGMLNDKSVNLEVSEDYCETNCSKDKKDCKFENGIQIEEVLNYININ